MWLVATLNSLKITSLTQAFQVLLGIASVLGLHADLLPMVSPDVAHVRRMIAAESARQENVAAHLFAEQFHL